MNDRQLRYATAVWRERSFSRAAEKLGVSQPSLSEQVRNLESGLGFALFERTSRGVEPSNAGRTFLARAEELLFGLVALEELAHELKGAPESTLRIGLNSGLASAYVPILAATVNAADPPCRLELTTATTRRVQRLVAQKRLDAGLLIQGETKAMPPDIKREPFAATDLVLLMPRDHALALSGSPIDIAQVAAQPLILNEPRIGYGRALMNAFDAHGLTPDIAAVSDDLDTVKLLVRAGAGVAPVPRIAVARDVADGAFAARRVAPTPAIPLLLVRREEPASPRVERCIEALLLAQSAAD
jgi:DNA-binding transcriptional LysR family regulator